MSDPACRHTRTRLIAADKDSRYLECLDCGEILEAEEVARKEAASVVDDGESLSDA